MKYEDLKSHLNYISMAFGNTEARFDNIFLKEDNFSCLPFFILSTKDDGSWMEYDYITHSQAKEFLVEANFAYGKVILSGLGLGVLTSILEKNDAVNEIVVYEKNKEVIDAFNFFVKISKFPLNKTTVINKDANLMQGEECDCLFLDHYEHEHFKYILDNVKKIADNNKHTRLWFWPLVKRYLFFCENQNLNVNIQSFEIYIKRLNLPTIIDDLPESIFADIRKLQIDLKKKFTIL